MASLLFDFNIITPDNTNIRVGSPKRLVVERIYQDGTKDRTYLTSTRSANRIITVIDGLMYGLGLGADIIEVSMMVYPGGNNHNGYPNEEYRRKQVMINVESPLIAVYVPDNENGEDTEYLIQSSVTNSFSNPTVEIDWTKEIPYFDMSPNAFYRMKARNIDGEETAWSEIKSRDNIDAKYISAYHEEPTNNKGLFPRFFAYADTEFAGVLEKDEAASSQPQHSRLDPDPSKQYRRIGYALSYTVTEDPSDYTGSQKSLEEMQKRLSDMITIQGREIYTSQGQVYIIRAGTYYAAGQINQSGWYKQGNITYRTYTRAYSVDGVEALNYYRLKYDGWVYRSIAR